MKASCHDPPMEGSPRLPGMQIKTVSRAGHSWPRAGKGSPRLPESSTSLPSPEKSAQVAGSGESVSPDSGFRRDPPPVSKAASGSISSRVE